MKKNLWSLLGILLFLTSCSNEDDFKDHLFKTENTRSDNHFSGVKIPDKISTKGIAQKYKLWSNGTTIKVKFLNGSNDYKQKVKSFAKEWEKYANIKFDFIESGDAQVRIGFDWNNERYITWSYIGTDCEMVNDQNDATMSFADSKYLSDEEFHAEVLRMFGMVLGLELEHRQIDFNPQWRRDISRYWTNEVLDIPWKELAKYVFNPLKEADTVHNKEYDPLSIMVWPFPKSYLLNSDGNLILSDTDKQFIAKLYPKDNDLGEPILSFTFAFNESKDKPKKNILFYCIFSNDVIIDLGDNILWGGETKYTLRNTEGIFSNMLLNFDFTESKLSEHTIKIYGDSKALKLVLFGGFDNIKYTKNLDISKNEALTDFYFQAFNLDKIDVSKNQNLEILSLGKNNLESIDISNNKFLSVIYIENNPITENLENLQSFIHQMPDRTGKKRGTISKDNGIYTYGELQLSDHPNIDFIKDEVEAKNWDLSICND